MPDGHSGSSASRPSNVGYDRGRQQIATSIMHTPLEVAIIYAPSNGEPHWRVKDRAPRQERSGWSSIARGSDPTGHRIDLADRDPDVADHVALESDTEVRRPSTNRHEACR